jgi:hypothetical protein
MLGAISPGGDDTVIVGVVPLLLVVVVVVTVIVVAERKRSGRPAPPAAEGPAAPPAGPDRDVDLARWVSAGLLSESQSAAIRAFEEAEARPPARAVAAAAPARVRRAAVPVVSEALGYLGGVLALVGLVLVVGRFWPDMALAGRLALSGGGAVVLFAAGAFVREGTDPALSRLRWFLWFTSTAAAALFAGVLAADGFDAEATETVVLACSGAVALVSGLLWWGHERPLQQLTCLGALVVFGGAVVAEVAGPAPVGLTVWASGVVLVGLGLRRGTRLPELTEAVGGVSVVVGPMIATSEWIGAGLALALASSVGLVSLAVVRGFALSRAEQVLLGAIGGLALLFVVPSNLTYFGAEAGVLTGVVVWLVGAGLVVVGARRLIRFPLVAEVLGGLALVGGAALTGAQAPGFASIFGVLTGLALVALGMVPGRVLMSVFGSLGLLINVPWLITWYFPGEGRAPVLLMVSGLLLLAIAVLLTRMGGRFRRELGSERRDDGPERAPTQAVVREVVGP